MSQIGFRISAGSRRGLGEVLAQCTAAKSPVALIVSLNQNIWPDVEKHSPQTTYIYRDDRYGADPFNDAFFKLDEAQAYAKGVAWVNTYAPVWRLNKAHYYGIVNEPGVHTEKAYKLYNAFSLGAMARANELGFKLCLYDWSFGNPDLNLLQHLIPSLKAAKADGHIFAVHEYSGVGPMMIDGQPANDYILRYRKLYAALPVEARCKIAITEAGPGAGYGTGLSGTAYVNDVSAYDVKVMEDRAYVIGVALFDLGNKESNIEPILPQLGTYISTHPTPAITPEPETPPVTNDGFGFVVVSHLVPQDTTHAEYDKVQAVAVPARQDVLFSADIAKSNTLRGKPGSKVIVWQPDRWTAGSIVDYLAPAPVELRYFSDVPRLNVPYLSQLDPVDADYGVGDCGAACAAMNLRKFGRAVTVDDVSQATGEAQGFPSLSVEKIVKASAVFGRGLKHVIGLTPAGVFAEIGKGHPVMALINYAMLPDSLKYDKAYKRGHFVLIVGGDSQTVVYHDPYYKGTAGAYKTISWTDFDKAWSTLNDDFQYPHQALVWTDLPQAAPVAVGLHDLGGLDYMLARGLTGVGLDHVCVSNQPVRLDYSKYAAAGIDVIVRINYGYADGTGTLPPPGLLAAFEAAVVATMKAARGVKYFQYGNEVNNRAEWPTGSAITPAGYVDSYNRVWRDVPASVLVGPSAIDPYFGPGSNNRDWWTYILNNIIGADVLFIHPKTQTNDPNEIESTARFSDDPLKWQYLHFRTLETSLEVVPTRFKTRPVYITEANPQRIDAKTLGWKPDNTEWVRRCKSYVKNWNAAGGQRISGIVFYRWDNDAWALRNKPELLAEIFK